MPLRCTDVDPTGATVFVALSGSTPWSRPPTSFAVVADGTPFVARKSVRVAFAVEGEMTFAVGLGFAAAKAVAGTNSAPVAAIATVTRRRVVFMRTLSLR